MTQLQIYIAIGIAVWIAFGLVAAGYGTIIDRWLYRNGEWPSFSDFITNVILSAMIGPIFLPFIFRHLNSVLAAYHKRRSQII